MSLATQNFTTFAARVSAVTDTQESLWEKQIALGTIGHANPFYDLIGGILDMKPIMAVGDFRNVKGQEIVFTLDRPLGGPGRQGSDSLIGFEEEELHATYRAKIGHVRHAVATDALTIEETVIGSNWDNRTKGKLKEWFAWRMANDVMFEMESNRHFRNEMFAGGRWNRDGLTSANYLTLGDIEAARDIAVSNHAQPFKLKKSKGGADIYRYLCMGSQYSFAGMKGSATYQNLIATAGNRGDGNYLFGGGLPDWDNILLHSWMVQNGTQFGPVGALCCPIAFLGAEIPATSTTTAQTIKGGGSVTAGAKTVPQYFRDFSNAEYKGHEGVKIAADTSTTRYLAVRVISGADKGKIAMFSYQVNSGNTITQVLRLGASITGAIHTTVGEMVYGSGNWVTGTGGFLTTGILPVGSEIYEVNAKGQPFVRTWLIARHMAVAGWGTLKDGAAKFGMRIADQQDYGYTFGIGWRQTWGVTASQDANNMVNGFVCIESAFNPRGWPTIIG